MQPIIGFQHLNTPLILGIDGINNLGITYLSIPNEFVFQSECTQSQFNKADLMTVSTVKIPPLSTVPVRLGTAIGRRHTPMAAGFKSVSTIGNPSFPALCAQPGLVVPDHQGDVTIMLQNCSNVDMEIPRCTAMVSLKISKIRVLAQKTELLLQEKNGKSNGNGNGNGHSSNVFEMNEEVEYF